MSQQTFLQNKPAAVAPKETITHHFLFWNWAEENCRLPQPKFVAAQKMLLKQKPSKHSLKWIARFIALGIYTPLSALCIAHNNCMSCPSIWATLSTAH